MKISVCIPIYNFDITALVYDLKFEINFNEIPAEILLIDDASDEKFRGINKNLVSNYCTYVQLDKNIGRSKIRNLFLQHSDADHLLFLDCDCKIISANFLKNYLAFINENQKAEVIYGGRTLPKEKPMSQYLLRWKYAQERENLNLSARKLSPWISFQTNNFLIKRNLFNKYQFDENFNNYGYEDLLFALNLKKERIKIFHFENPVLNIDLETSERYLSKVEESIATLSQMLKSEKSAKIVKDIKVVKAYSYLKKFHMKDLILNIFKSLKNSLRKNLLNNPKSLRVLDFYKLGLLCENMK